MKSTILTRTSLVLAGLIAATLGAVAVEAGAGRYRFNQDNAAGWTLMNQEERAAHQQKMWSFKSYDECKAYQAQHHEAMAARAKEQGVTLRVPRHNACDQMQARGVLK